MCSCIKTVKERIKSEVAEKNPDYSNLEIHNVTCDGEAWVFTKSGTVSGLSIPFTAYHKPIGRKKSTQINMVARYCPFCGKEYGSED